MLALMTVSASAQSSAVGEAKLRTTTGVTTTELKSDSESGLPQASLEKGDRNIAGSRERIFASELLGEKIYARDGSEVGKIADVLMSEKFNGLVAVIGIGGFMGLGSRTVAIPTQQIEMSRDGEGALRLIAATTHEQLLAAPAFDRTALMR